MVGFLLKWIEGREKKPIRHVRLVNKHPVKNECEGRAP